MALLSISHSALCSLFAQCFSELDGECLPRGSSVPNDGAMPETVCAQERQERNGMSKASSKKKNRRYDPDGLRNWMMENRTRILKGVQEFQMETGRTPELVTLQSMGRKPGQIGVFGTLSAVLKGIPKPVGDAIKLRRNDGVYEKGNYPIVVIAENGFSITTCLVNMESQHELNRTGGTYQVVDMYK